MYDISELNPQNELKIYKHYAGNIIATWKRVSVIKSALKQSGWI